MSAISLKIYPDLGASALEAIEEHIPELYNVPGKKLVAIVELARREVVSPDPDSDGKCRVSVRIIGLETVTTDLEDALREAMRALFLMRTASGTLDEDGTVQLSEDTVTGLGGRLGAIQSTRLRAAIKLAADRGRISSHDMGRGVETLRADMENMTAILTRALRMSDFDEEEDTPEPAEPTDD